MVSPGVVVITPDWRPGDVGSSPCQGIQPIFSEEYVKREKRKKMPIYLYVCSLSLPHLCFSFEIRIKLKHFITS